MQSVAVTRSRATRSHQIKSWQLTELLASGLMLATGNRKLLRCLCNVLLLHSIKILCPVTYVVSLVFWGLSCCVAGLSTADHKAF